MSVRVAECAAKRSENPHSICIHRSEDVPANRTHDWQRSLRQVYERGGSLDLAIATDHGQQQDGANVLWRVRLLDLTQDAIIVEQPSTLGSDVVLQPGVELVIILTIGQNRWMFRTQYLDGLRLAAGGGRHGTKPTAAIRLAMPEHVERCQRRANYRVSTASLKLPDVDIWPLLDPKTVIVAERANELEFERESDAQSPDDIRLPEVGPRFRASLVNLGGGGVGLTVPSTDSQSLLRHKLFWMRIELPPDLKAPICATAKVVHTHMTASQDYYAGLAFDFTFNPAHQRYVVEQIGRYVASVQRTQMMRKSA